MYRCILLIVIIIILLTSYAIAEELQRTLFFPESLERVPLFSNPDQNADILGYCYNSLTITLLSTDQDNWVYIKIGEFGNEIKGYMSKDYIYDLNSPKATPIHPKVVSINSANVEIGAPLFTGAGSLQYNIPNGDTVTIQFIDNCEMCLVSYGSVPQQGLVYGFISTDELAPLDGTAAYYPYDPYIMLNGYTYEFTNYLPSDIASAFDAAEWSEAKPLLGGIAANRGSTAFVVMETHDQTYLCYLIKRDGIWLIDGITAKALYQDEIKPSQIAFSRYGVDAHIYFTQGQLDHFERVSLVSADADASFDEWFLSNAYYSPHGLEYQLFVEQVDNKLNIKKTTDQIVSSEVVEIDVPFTLSTFSIQGLFVLAQ